MSTTSTPIPSARSARVSERPGSSSSKNSLKKPEAGYTSLPNIQFDLEGLKLSSGRDQVRPSSTGGVSVSSARSAGSGLSKKLQASPYAVPLSSRYNDPKPPLSARLSSGYASARGISKPSSVRSDSNKLGALVSARLEVGPLSSEEVPPPSTPPVEDIEIEEVERVVMDAVCHISDDQDPQAPLFCNNEDQQERDVACHDHDEVSRGEIDGYGEIIDETIEEDPGQDVIDPVELERDCHNYVEDEDFAKDCEDCHINEEAIEQDPFVGQHVIEPVSLDQDCHNVVEEAVVSGDSGESHINSEAIEKEPGLYEAAIDSADPAGDLHCNIDQLERDVSLGSQVVNDMVDVEATALRGASNESLNGEDYEDDLIEEEQMKEGVEDFCVAESNDQLGLNESLILNELEEARDRPCTPPLTPKSSVYCAHSTIIASIPEETIIPEQQQFRRSSPAEPTATPVEYALKEEQLLNESLNKALHAIGEPEFPAISPEIYVEEKANNIRPKKARSWWRRVFCFAC